MVRLFIVRHGDPDYDTNRENGGTLTENGKKEADALSNFFCGMNEPTHAYSSPMGRARLTAKLALSKSKHFSGDSFDANVGVEEWSRELSNWRLGRPEYVTDPTKKPPAVWDLPASITRSRMGDTKEGTDESIQGWTHTCVDHAVYADEYAELCAQSDAFLERHGIYKHLDAYKISGNNDNRRANIVVFCHAGLSLTWLSHLLHIPLPLVHSSFWLAPSSVTTVLFDESQGAQNNHQNMENGDADVVITPRALCVGGTDHLAAAGLQTSNSRYENYERPSGLKTNSL